MTMLLGSCHLCADMSADMSADINLVAIAEMSIDIYADII